MGSVSVPQAPLFSAASLSQEARQYLLEGIFPLDSQQASEDSPEDFDAYFSFFRYECSKESACDHAISTFGNLISVVAIIRGSPSTTLSSIPGLLAAADPSLDDDEKKLFRSLELALRLWLMVNIRIVMPQSVQEKKRCIPWPPGMTLREVLEKHLCSVSTSHLAAAGEFSMHMNVSDMRRIAGFQVRWTNDLTDHLKMAQRVVYMHHHVSILRRLQSTQASATIPRSFVDETLATINLLIPHSKASCNTWLRAEIDSAHLDPNIMYRETADRCRDEFQHWRERLLSISEAFATAKPSSLGQWWHDRRDMGQWWGFWLVMAGIFLAVLFGLIQSVTGILQLTLARGSE